MCGREGCFRGEGVCEGRVCEGWVCEGRGKGVCEGRVCAFVFSVTTYNCTSCMHTYHTTHTHIHLSSLSATTHYTSTRAPTNLTHLIVIFHLCPSSPSPQPSSPSPSQLFPITSTPLPHHYTLPFTTLPWNSAWSFRNLLVMAWRSDVMVLLMWSNSAMRMLLRVSQCSLTSSASFFYRGRRDTSTC